MFIEHEDKYGGHVRMNMRMNTRINSRVRMRMMIACEPHFCPLSWLQLEAPAKVYFTT